MYSSDTSVEAAALSALQSLMRTLYPTLGDAPVGLAQDVIKQCLEVLEDPEKTQGLAATKCLVELIKASRESAAPHSPRKLISVASTAKFALSQALPQLFKQFNRPSLPSHRTPVLWSISSLLIAASKVYASPDAGRPYAAETSLELYRDPLIDTLRGGLRTESLREPAIRGCVALVEVPQYWGRSEVENVTASMDDILLNDSSADIR